MSGSFTCDTLYPAIGQTANKCCHQCYDGSFPLNQPTNIPKSYTDCMNNCFLNAQGNSINPTITKGNTGPCVNFAWTDPSTWGICLTDSLSGFINSEVGDIIRYGLVNLVSIIIVIAGLWMLIGPTVMGATEVAIASARDVRKIGRKLSGK